MIGRGEFIKGNVDIMEIVIYGRVEGDIIAKSVELKTGSRVDGNITTSNLVIKTPWPSMLRTCWGEPDRYEKYWNTIPGYYFATFAQKPSLSLIDSL